MKWFFAFNQASEHDYGDFVRCAVVSAREKTTLQAFCLYDGSSCQLTRWLERQGVVILPARFRFAHWWQELAQRQNDPFVLQVAMGTFLRFELPEILEREAISDSYVLYTDCDMIFTRDAVALLEPLKPHFFAVAPETYQENRLHMNAGVMWMNSQTMRDENARFMEFAGKHMKEASQSSFDQGIYRAYFDSLHKLAWQFKVPNRLFYAVMTRLQIKTWKWDDLPLELNWKPYWGENEDAAIIHFHGLKPTHRAQLVAKNIAPSFAAMHTPAFDRYAAQWDEWLRKARAL